MPNELESYALTLVKSIISGKPLPDDVTPEQSAAAHKRQADMLIELVVFLLNHYVSRGYSGVTLGAVLLRTVRVWWAEHLPTK